tara:strand:- start:893 stop:1318 length:426 start_codon:yes stop_codon:yes gene_type:complete
MFLYQSENDSHFECPQCGQRGTVKTAYLDGVLQRNEHAVISCTKCKARFAPHAPTADRLRVNEPVNDKVGSTPQMTKDEADDKGNKDDAFASEDDALPELERQWRRHETNTLAMPNPPDAGTNSAKGTLPLWLRPQSEKKN